MSNTLPKILLIGAGRFGQQHLIEWKRLVAEERASLTGIVVATADSQQRIARMESIPVFSNLDADLLREVDAVDIVTPSSTHFEIASTCLRYAHVLVEKPAALKPEQVHELGRTAKRENKVLMVGHIYRFNPLVHELKNLVLEIDGYPRLITGGLTNPPEPGIEGLDPRVEFLHLFDIIDYLFDAEPSFCISVERGQTNRISIRYRGPFNAVIEIGWIGTSKRRSLSLIYDDQRIDCDFNDNSIIVNKRGSKDKIYLDSRPQSLRNELSAFLDLVHGKTIDYPDAGKAANIVAIAVNSEPVKLEKRPRVAIIGGGIFGATCAIEIGRFCDVTLFERHSELMTEASYFNQWRHHSGFHYPRSPLTVREVIESADSFVARYDEAILWDIPCYYGTSATGREITADRYRAVCEASGLKFEVAFPPGTVVDESKLSLCLKTDESVLDYYRLRTLIERELSESPNVTEMRETEVISGEFGLRGEKRLTFRHGEETQVGEFDFLINATYANRNILAGWFQFPSRPLRFDLLELLVLELDIPQMSITILDGPFTTLTGMGYDNLFMLSHIHESILKSAVVDKGPPPEWGEITSNRANLLKHARYYLPVLDKARVVESRFGVRAVYAHSEDLVNAHSEDFDGRPTVVTEHGFGCWSVLGGKIITCVSNAQEIARGIRYAQGNASVDALASKPHDNRAARLGVQ